MLQRSFTFFLSNSQLSLRAFLMSDCLEKDGFLSP